MRGENERGRSLLERPGRLAAVGTAVVVCALSVSAAMGVSFTSDAAHATQPVTHEDPGHPARGGPPHTYSGSSDVPPSGGSTQTTPPVDDDPAKSLHQDENSTVDAAALPAHSGEGRRIVFDMTSQRVWLVGPAGHVVRTYPVSGSKYDNLNPGTYTVSSKSRYATAYNSDETLNYMVRFAYGRTAPIGFHAIPVRPDGSLVESRAGLGKPASDGCIRQWRTDALALWNFAPVGTRVDVVA